MVIEKATLWFKTLFRRCLKRLGLANASRAVGLASALSIAALK
jgi:hypothetical protein